VPLITPVCKPPRVAPLAVRALHSTRAAHMAGRLARSMRGAWRVPARRDCTGVLLAWHTQSRTLAGIGPTSRVCCHGATQGCGVDE
jgi:hypothetical protein